MENRERQASSILETTEFPDIPTGLSNWRNDVVEALLCLETPEKLREDIEHAMIAHYAYACRWLTIVEKTIKESDTMNTSLRAFEHAVSDFRAECFHCANGNMTLIDTTSIEDKNLSNFIANYADIMARFHFCMAEILSRIIDNPDAPIMFPTPENEFDMIENLAIKVLQTLRDNHRETHEKYPPHEDIMRAHHIVYPADEMRHKTAETHALLDEAIQNIPEPLPTGSGLKFLQAKATSTRATTTNSTLESANSCIQDTLENKIEEPYQNALKALEGLESVIDMHFVPRPSIVTEQ